MITQKILNIKSFLTMLAIVMVVLIGAIEAKAATELQTGDLAITGINVADREELTFVLLKDIEAGTILYITDNGWNGTSFASNNDDNIIEWKATNDLQAGKVVYIIKSNPSNLVDYFPKTNCGTVRSLTNPDARLGLNGDQVYIYQGVNENTPTTVITGINYNIEKDSGTNKIVTTNGSWDGICTNESNTLLPTQLKNNQTSLWLRGKNNEARVKFLYMGLKSGTPNELRSKIHNIYYWYTEVEDVNLYPLSSNTISFTVQDSEPPNGGVNRLPVSIMENTRSIKKGNVYTFNLSDFSYYDPDGDLLNHIEFNNLPNSFTFWVDNNKNDIVDNGESALVLNDTVSVNDIAEFRLKCFTNISTDSTYTYYLNDGQDNSAAVSAAITVLPDPKVSLTLVNSSDIDEENGSTQIKVTAEKVLEDDMTINLAFSGTALNGTDYNASSSMVISKGSSTATIPLTAINDTCYEGNETIIIDIDSVVNGLENGEQKVSTAINDNSDKPNITMSIDNSEISEEAGFSTITLLKTGETNQNTIVNLVVTGQVDSNDYSLENNTITFMPNETSKTVKFFSTQDTIDENDEEACIEINTVTNGNEDGNQTAIVKIIDDDMPPLVSIEFKNELAGEGSASAYLIAKLSQKSGKNIVVNVSYLNSETDSAIHNTDFTSSNQITVINGQLQGQIEIGINDDNMAELQEKIYVVMTTTENAIKLNDNIVSKALLDNDTPIAQVVKTNGSTVVNESGSSDTVTIQLATQPINTVELDLSSNDTGEFTISPSKLTFTHDNYAPQVVTITGQNDYIIDGNQNIDITVDVNNIGSDPAYLGLNTISKVVIEDDDYAGYTVTETEGSTAVVDNGSTDTFSVVLTARPIFDVVLDVTLQSTDRVTVDKSDLVFNMSNWNKPQIVTVKGTNNVVHDGDKNVNISIFVVDAESDDNFDSLANSNIEVLVVDDDIPDILINELGQPNSVDENGTISKQIAVTLSIKPTDNVTVNLTNPDSTELEVSPTVLTFTPDDYNIAKDVIIKGKTDNIVDGDIENNIYFETTSLDNNYINLDKILRVVTTDNDYALVRVTSNNISVPSGQNTASKEYNTDFGYKLFDKDGAKKIYTIHNDGNSTLEVSDISQATSWFSVSNTNMSIAPGSSDTFMVEFTGIFPGKHSGIIFINSNDKNAPYYFLVKGEVINDDDAPIITSTYPANNAIEVATNPTFSIGFNENIEAQSGYIYIKNYDNNSIVEQISINDALINNNTVEFSINKSLNNSTKYYIEIDNNCIKDVYLTSFTGISNKNTWCFTTKKASSSSNGSSYNYLPITVNDDKQSSIAKVKNKYKDGKKTILISFNETKLLNQLRQKSKSTLTIPVLKNADSVKTLLNGKMIKEMENKEVVLEIKTKKGSYILPVEQINIDEILSKIGENIDLKDITVEINISDVSKEMSQVVKNTVNSLGLNLVLEPVEFAVNCSYKTKRVSISKYNTYVMRKLELPEGFNPNKITTAIVIYPDGSVCHIPTKVVKISNFYYAQISSLTNSTYALIYNPQSYSDIKGHWAENVCNETSAKMFIEPQSKTVFGPSEQISRLYFTKTIVKALGLGNKGNVNKFSDVHESDEYFGYIATALEYNLIGGYEVDNSFRPHNKITREEAAALIVRTMKLAGLNVEITPEEVNAQLAKFKDDEKVGNWAKRVVAICVKNNLIKGNMGELTPKSNITKAELASIIYRLLIEANLI